MFRKHRPPVGARPGAFVIAPDAVAPVIRVIEYDADTVTEYDVESVGDLRSRLHADKQSWIDVQGLGDEGVLRELQEAFHIDVAPVPYKEHDDIKVWNEKFPDVKFVTHEYNLLDSWIGYGTLSIDPTIKLI